MEHATELVYAEIITRYVMPYAPKRFMARQRVKPLVDTRKGFRGRNRQEAKHRVYRRDQCKCQQCGAFVLPSESHLDHITPLAQGGGHGDENLRTLCLRCHASRR